MSNRAAKLAKQQKLKQMAEKTRIRISPLGIVLGVATLIGGIAALLTLLPRVTPTVSDPVDLENPFSSSVTITNTGYIPLRAVSVKLGIGQMTTCSPGNPCVVPEFPNPQREYGFSMQRAQWVTHDLGLDERFTVPLDDVTSAAQPGGLAYADIAVIIRYTIPLIGWEREKTFPLYTRKASNGKLYWQWK